MLDKAVGYGTKSSGHATNASTTEKISDGIRSGFKKLTGKDVVRLPLSYSDQANETANRRQAVATNLMNPMPSSPPSCP